MEKVVSMIIPIEHRKMRIDDIEKFDICQVTTITKSGSEPKTTSYTDHRITLKGELLADGDLDSHKVEIDIRDDFKNNCGLENIHESRVDKFRENNINREIDVAYDPAGNKVYLYHNSLKYN